MIKESWNFTASWVVLKLLKWKDFQRMLLSLEEAFEVLGSELFQYCRPLTAGQVVVGIFLWSNCTKPAISQLGKRGYAKITHHTFRLSFVGRG